MADHAHDWKPHCQSPSCTWRHCQGCETNERLPCLCGHPLLAPATLMEPGQHAHVAGAKPPNCSCGCPTYRQAS